MTSRSEERRASIFFSNFENESNVFPRTEHGSEFAVFLYDTPGMSAVVEEQRFRELLNSDILLKF